MDIQLKFFIAAFENIQDSATRKVSNTRHRYVTTNQIIPYRADTRV